MNRDSLLYEYLIGMSKQLTEEWYASLDKEATGGVYTSVDPAAVDRLKEQNEAFHRRFAKIFITPEDEFLKIFEGWVLGIVQDEGHLKTPSYLTIGEFMRTQNQYLDVVDRFIEACGHCTMEDANRWKNLIVKGIGMVISWFLKEQHAYGEKKRREQQQTINRLSSPVITLSKHMALLPLIGHIDETRAAFMLENTLEVCSWKGVRRLLIDLSGVVAVNTLVAHQIFQLVDALALIGVDATLSGIRSEIAQTAAEFGDRFSRMEIVTDLEKAIGLYLK